MKNFSAKGLTGLAIFLLAIFVVVPIFISATGRWDFYFTLTSVALLAIASDGGDDIRLEIDHADSQVLQIGQIEFIIRCIQRDAHQKVELGF